MKILGMGLLFAGGRGVDSLRQTLSNGWREPLSLTVRDRSIPVYGVNLERIQDKAVLKKLRRSDKLSKMAVLAATDAIVDSGLGEKEATKLGIIVATAFGAHVTTFEFLDGILDFGDAAVSPTAFSNSVHNAAASYISSALGIQGPTLTVTQFFSSFPSALQLAQAWLQEGRVEHVLVGAVDQFGDVMGYIADSRLTLAPDGRIKPFLLGSGFAVPGEGAAFFLLGRAGGSGSYASISDIRFGDHAPGPDRADLAVIDSDGLIPDESVYLRSLVTGAQVAAYSPLYGSMVVGAAFSAAAAAITLKDQIRYASPVPDNPHGLPILSETAESSIDFIECIRYNCTREKSTIQIRKS